MVRFCWTRSKVVVTGALLALVIITVLFYVSSFLLSSFKTQVKVETAQVETALHDSSLPHIKVSQTVQIFKNDTLPGPEYWKSVEKLPDMCYEFFSRNFSNELFSMTKSNLNLSHHYDSRSFGLDQSTAAVMRELFSIIDAQPLPILAPGSTCVVVGSSGVLTTKNISEKIDSYDYVFRFNNAPVETHKRFVGSKISFYLTYYRALNLAIRGSRKDKAHHVFYVMTHKGEVLAPLYYTDKNKFDKIKANFPPEMSLPYGDPVESRIYQEMSSFFKNSKITFLSPYFGRKVRQQLLKNKSARATSGLLGVLLAVSMCPNPPDIAGFSLKESNLYPYHYYSTSKNSSLTNMHSASVELDVFKRLFGCQFLGSDLTNELSSDS